MPQFHELKNNFQTIVYNLLALAVSKCTTRGCKMTFTVNIRSFQAQQSLVLVFSHFKSVVERKPVEENIGEELAQAEDTIHHPVRQPFCVVLFAHTFNGFDPAEETTRQTF